MVATACSNSPSSIARNFEQGILNRLETISGVSSVFVLVPDKIEDEEENENEEDADFVVFDKR